MKVVVTGGGAVGRHLAQDLADRGHDVTLVEQKRDLAEKLAQWAPDTRVVYGDACEPRILESADMRSADVLVAATGDDEDNLVTSHPTSARPCTSCVSRRTRLSWRSSATATS